MKVLIAIPAYNEGEGIRHAITELVGFFGFELSGVDLDIVIVDNASRDRTGEEGRALEQEYPCVIYRHIERKGKGLAIRTAWDEFDADVYVFMDADLSTDLSALPDLLKTVQEHGGIATGTRFADASRVQRSALRSMISRGYRAWVALLFGKKVPDLPCGFKAVSREVVQDVMPLVKDDSWFFDSELLLRARRCGYSIREVPVTWRERRTSGSMSKVFIPQVVAEYLIKTIVLRWDMEHHEKNT